MSAQPLSPADLAKALLDLSQRHVTAAARGDWLAATAALDERAPLVAAIARLDPAELDEPARTTLRAALTAVLELDQECTRLGTAAQTVMQQDLGRLRQGRRALRSYGRAGHEGDGLLIDRPG